MPEIDAKKFYNEEMPGKFGDDYEHERWFKNAIQKAGYILTKDAIVRHVLYEGAPIPLRVFELGPGAGTWTKLLLARFPDAYYDLIDISREMLARARNAIGERENVRYVESEFLSHQAEGKYDLFFSSRVLEYISDKKLFAKRVHDLLAPGGVGFLITKMPHYERDRFLGRKKSDFHQGQIAPAALMETLREVGFIDVEAYPVTMSVPLLHSPRANLLLGKLLAPFPLGLFGAIFAESYAVVFRRPSHH